MGITTFVVRKMDTIFDAMFICFYQAEKTTAIHSKTILSELEVKNNTFFRGNEKCQALEGGGEDLIPIFFWE
jgi:hypothetical protein